MPSSSQQHYTQNGYASLGQVFSPEECQALKSAISTWLGPDPQDNPYGILRNNCWRDIPRLERTLDRLAQHALALLGTSSLTLFQDNLIWKKPQGRQAISWHQDFAYWPLNSPSGVTFWIPLDDVNVDNGCVHVIPESHGLGEFAATNFTERGTASWGDSRMAFEIGAHIEKAQGLPLPKGELLAFHPLLWHMSPANTSTRDRCAWSLTWITDAVRWDPDHAPHPFCHWLQPQKNDRIEGEQFLRFSK